MHVFFVVAQTEKGKERERWRATKSAFNFDGQPVAAAAAAAAALIVMAFNWCEPTQSQTEMDMRTCGQRDMRTEADDRSTALRCDARRGDMARVRGPTN